MGVTFTSEPLTAGVGFSGNVMRKGLAADDGQVTISTSSTEAGAAAFCRMGGTNGFQPLQRYLDDPDIEEVWVNELSPLNPQLSGSIVVLGPQ